MRSFNAKFATAICSAIVALTGCSSFSATIINADAGASGGAAAGGESNTAGTAGGEPSTLGANSSGGAKSVGGVSSTPESGGASANSGGAQAVSTSLGGSSSAGGASALGGVTSVGGTSALGGIASIGGTSASPLGGASTTLPATGGVSPSLGGASAGTGGFSASMGGALPSTGGASAATGGTSACTKNEDCANPDPTNCSYTCVNPGTAGTCKAALLTSPTKCATDDCAERAISGFWSDGKPYIAYGFTESDGSASIRMQQLRLDGTREGEAGVYELPALQTESSLLSANAQGNKVGLLWYGIQGRASAAGSHDMQFTTTDLSGSFSRPAVIDGSQGGLGNVQFVWLQVTPAGAWLALSAYGHSGAFWKVASGSTIAAWSGFSGLTSDAQLGAGVVGSTLVLTGADCPSISTCTQKFVVQRYAVASLATIGAPITLSVNSQGASPAIGPVQEGIAIIWTESQSPGSLFRTLMKEDGTFAVAVSTIQSAVQPKALVASPNSGALLIGTIVTSGPNGARYQVVAQRLDADLNLIGSPLPLADSQNEDANTFETRLSSDGEQVLVTYHHVGARFRLLPASLCQ